MLNFKSYDLAYTLSRRTGMCFGIDIKTGQYYVGTRKQLHKNGVVRTYKATKFGTLQMKQ